MEDLPKLPGYDLMLAVMAPRRPVCENRSCKNIRCTHPECTNKRDAATQTVISIPGLAIVPEETVRELIAPKTLKDSRWATDGKEVICNPQASNNPRPTGQPHRNDANEKPKKSELHPIYEVAEEPQRPKGAFDERNNLWAPRRARHHDDADPPPLHVLGIMPCLCPQCTKRPKEKEAAPEPPRVHFDRDEFCRGVRDNGFKKLGDSPWAQTRDLARR